MVSNGTLLPCLNRNDNISFEFGTAVTRRLEQAIGQRRIGAINIQLSNLIQSLRIISRKISWAIKKNCLSPSKSQIFNQLFCVAHS